jgi:hypothetical protein
MLLKNTKNYRKFRYNDIIYWIGKNATGNTYIVNAAQQQINNFYYWFHDELTSSAHLIVELIDNRKLSQLEKQYFASKINKSSQVCLTNINNIKLTNTPGQVTILDRKLIELILI